MAESLSQLLTDILKKHGLTEIAPPEKFKKLSDEEKNKLYETQKLVIDEFRQKSTEEINKLQEEYVRLQSKPPQSHSPPPQAVSGPVKLTTINAKRQLNQSKIDLKNTKQIKPLSKSSSFDADTLNRKNTRPVREGPQPVPSHPSKVHYDNLDQRPRFKH